MKGACRGGIQRTPWSCLGEEQVEGRCTKKLQGGLQNVRREERRGSLLQHHLNTSTRLNARAKEHDQRARERGGDGQNGGRERHKIACGEHRSRVGLNCRSEGVKRHFLL